MIYLNDWPQITLYEEGGSSPSRWSSTHPLSFVSGDYILIAPPPVMTVYGTNIVFSNNITDASVVIGTGVNFAQDISFDAGPSNSFASGYWLTDQTAATANTPTINNLQLGQDNLPANCAVTATDFTVTCNYLRTATGFVTLNLTLTFTGTIPTPMDIDLPLPFSSSRWYLGMAMIYSSSGIYAGLILANNPLGHARIYNSNYTAGYQYGLWGSGTYNLPATAAWNVDNTFLATMFCQMFNVLP